MSQPFNRQCFFYALYNDFDSSIELDLTHWWYRLVDLHTVHLAWHEVIIAKLMTTDLVCVCVCVLIPQPHWLWLNLFKLYWINAGVCRLFIHIEPSSYPHRKQSLKHSRLSRPVFTRRNSGYILKTFPGSWTVWAAVNVDCGGSYRYAILSPVDPWLFLAVVTHYPLCCS